MSRCNFKSVSLRRGGRCPRDARAAHIVALKVARARALCKAFGLKVRF